VATVKLFGNLREIAGVKTVELSAENVGEALIKLCSQYETLQDAIFDGAALKTFVRVVINGQDIELAQGLKTSVSESSSIAIFPPIAGGFG
jgi:MoaD family protein